MKQRERLQAVIEDLTTSPVRSPDRERDIRICRAMFEEIRLLEQRIIAIDPATVKLADLRPLEDVVREHILAAVRATGSPKEAAETLDIGLATVYRVMGKASKTELEGIKYRGVAVGAFKKEAV